MVDFIGTELSPIATAVGASTQTIALIGGGQHRSGWNRDNGHIHTGRAHQLRRYGLIATANQDDGINGLSAHHLFGIERHQITQIHAGWKCKGLMHRYGWKNHGHTSGLHHAAFGSFNHLRDIAMAWIEIAESVRNANNRSIERAIAKAHGFNKCFAHE